MTYELAKSWVSHGHQVTVFTSNQMDQEREGPQGEEIIDGIRVFRFGNRFPRLARRLPSLFFAQTGMLKELQSIRGRFDVVHIAEARGPHVRWAAAQCAKQRIPIVWSAYGGLAKGSGARRIYRKAHDMIFHTARLVRAANGLIAQTENEAATYRAFGGIESQIRQIPLGINLSDLPGCHGRDAFRERLGILPTDQVILFLGRIHWTKGLQLLIPAFAKISTRVPNLKLVIVGWDHGFLKNVHRLIEQHQMEDRVVLAGPVYGNERFNAYAAADLFCLTSPVFEETSLAAVEACGMSKGCVLTKECEVPGLEDANCGKVVSSNIESIAEALGEAFERGTFSFWGGNAHGFVSRELSIEAVARRHEVFFSEIIGRIDR